MHWKKDIEIFERKNALLFKLTYRDIANCLKISPAMVSQKINGFLKMKPEERAEILDLIEHCEKGGCVDSFKFPL